MATINIGSENASDVFYRCGCAMEREKEEKRDLRAGETREGGERSRETSRMLACFFFFLFFSALAVVVWRPERRIDQLYAHAPLFSLSFSHNLHPRHEQVQDAAPPGQGEFGN